MSNEVPTNEVPTNEVPSNEVPSNEVPSNEVPSESYTEAQEHFVNCILAYTLENGSATNFIDQINSIYNLFKFINENFSEFYNSLNTDQKQRNMLLFEWIVNKADEMIVAFKDETGASTVFIKMAIELISKTRDLVKSSVYEELPVRRSARLARKNAVNYCEKIDEEEEEEEEESNNSSDEDYEESDDEAQSDLLQSKSLEEENQSDLLQSKSLEEENEENQSDEDEDISPVPAPYRRNLHPEVEVLIMFANLLLICCILMLMECARKPNSNNNYIEDTIFEACYNNKTFMFDEC